tara:strand:- start:177 stop:1190 length:1014 start_codon:yes stop_codon:yes gene_type:complete
MISKFKVKRTIYESYKKIMVIGEIGSNHDNNLKKCKKLILKAKEAGCDAVKFQLFKAEKLVSKKLNIKGYKILKKLELKESWIPILSRFCKKNKILFICSPFYHEAVDLLLKYKCDVIKIASPEIKNIPLIRKSILTNLPIIISTGDTNLNLINKAFKYFKKKNYSKIGFLQCTSQYPCEIENANLLNIKFLKKKLDPKISIGFSDHTLGIDASLIAVSMGANIIEKHITLNKKSKGPDHFFALEIKELKKMILRIRNFEKFTGEFVKKRLSGENTININLFSKKKIFKNEKLTSKNIIFKRDIMNGIPSYNINNILGRKLKFDIEEDEKIIYSLLK